MLLASLEEFAVYRQLSEFDPLDPSALLALGAASEVVRRYTGQSFDLIEDEVAHLDGTGTKELILPQRPVVGVSEVTAHDLWFDAEEILLDTAWVLGDYGTLLRLDGANWPYGPANIGVTYTHGFATTQDIPADLRLEVCRIAALIYASGLASTTGASSGVVVSEAIGGYSVTYGDGSTSASSTFLSVNDLGKLTLDFWRTPVLA